MVIYIMKRNINTWTSVYLFSA